jgi:hypothetical protein
MPILAGSRNFAGLLAVDLPNTIRKGEKYTVIVSQINNAAGSREIGANITGAGEEALSTAKPPGR